MSEKHELEARELLFFLADGGGKDEAVEAIAAKLAALEADRDEWRTQHDNAVACWYEERDRLAADAGRLRIADALGMVDRDDTGRIGRVATVDELLAEIARLGDALAAANEQRDEAKARADYAASQHRRYQRAEEAEMQARAERDEAQAELEALRSRPVVLTTEEVRTLLAEGREVRRDIEERIQRMERLDPETLARRAK